MGFCRASSAQGCRVAPHSRQRGLDFLLESGDQFAVAVDKRLLGFDFGDDGLLGGEGWNWDFDRFQSACFDSVDRRDRMVESAVH